MEQRRSPPAVACARAQRVGCPHAPNTSAPTRSRWLRIASGLACRCTARFRALLVFAGVVGIAGFCAASVGFFAGLLNEAQYLAGVVASMGLFAASVLLVRLGDPYELKRLECQRSFALQTLAVRPRPSQGPVARPPRAVMN